MLNGTNDHIGDGESKDVHDNMDALLEVERAERILAEDDSDMYDVGFNDIDSGRWDDDPSPYDGTYSEE